MTRSFIRHRHAEALVLINLALAGGIINLMVYQTGGYSSFYITGVILVSVVGLEIFRLSIKYSLAALIVNYGPTMLIIHWTAGASNIELATTQSVFIIGMVLIQAVSRISDEKYFQGWLNHEETIRDELAELRRSEFLTKHFPPALRVRINSGEEEFPKKKFIGNAVVGFADICASTALANKISLDEDWDLKEKFLEAATRRATQHNLIVLTHMGDGFLFLANYHQKSDWPVSLIAFFESLICDYEQISQSILGKELAENTGIKVAATMGPVILGFIGEDQTYFTAIGPDVNLAARLCDKVVKNEIIVSLRVWDILKQPLFSWDYETCKFDDLKGFSGNIAAIKIKARVYQKHNKIACPTCSSELLIIRTPEGHFDIVCPHGHQVDEAESQERISTY